MRILSKQASQHIGEKIIVQGWLHKKRLLGGLKAEPEPTEVPADTTPSADSPEVVQ